MRENGSRKSPNPIPPPEMQVGEPFGGRPRYGWVLSLALIVAPIVIAWVYR